MKLVKKLMIYGLVAPLLAVTGSAVAAPDTGKLDYQTKDDFFKKKLHKTVPRFTKKPSNYFMPFKCGPGFKTYSVSLPNSSSDWSHRGVRCVKFHNYKVIGKNIAGIYWYGEGIWQYQNEAKNYRHVAYTYEIKNPYNKAASRVGVVDAAFISDGELIGDYIPSDSEFKEIDGQNVLQLEGIVTERWTHEPSGKTSNYGSTMGKISQCAEGMEQLEVVTSQPNSKGMRCIFRNGEFARLPKVWFGDGTWGGKAYRHLGFVNQVDLNNPVVGYATAGDICKNGMHYCGNVPLNGLQIKADMSCGGKLKYTLSKAWGEKWQSTDGAFLNCPR